MTKTKYFAVSAAVVVGSFFMVQTAFAHDNHATVKDDTTHAKTVAELAKTERERAEDARKERETRTQELKQRVESMKAETKGKLDQKRKEVCEKRQVNVNKIITNSNAQGASNLAVFGNIQTKVMQFVTDKNLTVANYDALVADADAKRATAQAALEIAGQTTFSCDDTDPTHPGKVVSDLMLTKHGALKEYRTAIKNLIVAVKQAAGDKTQTTGGDQ